MFEGMMTIAVVAVVIGVVFLLFGPFFTVNQQTAAIVQRFGRFARVAQPGLNFRVPLIETINHVDGVLGVEVGRETELP